MSIHKNRNLDNLQPWFRPYVEEFLRRAKVGVYEMKINEGYRSPERQTYLYSLGRTRSGSIVTGAKAGQSDHQYGRAIDIYFVDKKGKANWNPKLFKEVSRVAKQLGFVWGGDWWRFRDRPHFFMKKPPKLGERFDGKIILDVDDKGKMFYINNHQRYYLNPNDLDTFKNLAKIATGFKHVDVLQIPLAE